MSMMRMSDRGQGWTVVVARTRFWIKRPGQFSCYESRTGSENEQHRLYKHGSRNNNSRKPLSPLAVQSGRCSQTQMNPNKLACHPGTTPRSCSRGAGIVVWDAHGCGLRFGSREGSDGFGYGKRLGVD